MAHHPYYRNAPLPPPPTFLPPVIPPSMFGRPHSHLGGLVPPSQPSIQHLGPSKIDAQPSSTMKETGVGLVSSTVDHTDPHRTRIKREDPDSPGSNEGRGHVGDFMTYDPSRVAVEGEADFVETNCHWTDCNVQFDTQDELVRVSLAWVI